MAALSDREIKAIIGRLTKLVNSRVQFLSTDTDSAAKEGDISVNSTGNICVFNNSLECVAMSETIFFRYASNVDFTGETVANVRAGRVTSFTDVLGFTSNVADASGTTYDWSGIFFGVTASTDPTDYAWTSSGTTETGGGADGDSVVLERSYTTFPGLLSEIGDPTTPGSGVTWISVDSPFTVPATAFFVADRFTIGTAVSAWQISPVQAKDGGLPFVTYNITEDYSWCSCTLGDAQLG